MLIEGVYMLYIYDPWDHLPSFWSFPRTGPKNAKKPKIWPLSGLHWPIIWRPRPKFELDVKILHIYPHTKFERARSNSSPVIAREKNLCSGGVTVMNPKYLRLCLGIQLWGQSVRNFGCCALIGCLTFGAVAIARIGVFNKSVSILLTIGCRGLQCIVNLSETICCESFGGVRFGLGPLLQGQIMAAQHKSAYISLILGSRGF